MFPRVEAPKLVPESRGHGSSRGPASFSKRGVVSEQSCTGIMETNSWCFNVTVFELKGLQTAELWTKRDHFRGWQEMQCYNLLDGTLRFLISIAVRLRRSKEPSSFADFKFALLTVRPHFDSPTLTLPRSQAPRQFLGEITCPQFHTYCGSAKKRSLGTRQILIYLCTCSYVAERI